MLDILRRGASSKFAALLLFIPLIVGFAFFGIGPTSLSSSRTYQIGRAHV